MTHYQLPRTESGEVDWEGVRFALSCYNRPSEFRAILKAEECE